MWTAWVRLGWAVSVSNTENGWFTFWLIFRTRKNIRREWCVQLFEFQKDESSDRWATSSHQSHKWRNWRSDVQGDERLQIKHGLPWLLQSQPQKKWFRWIRYWHSALLPDVEVLGLHVLAHVPTFHPRHLLFLLRNGANGRKLYKDCDGCLPRQLRHLQTRLLERQLRLVQRWAKS